MTIPITNVANSQVFGTLIQRTNDICDMMAQHAVTVDSTVGGSVSTGNAYINGVFGVLTQFVGNSTSNTIVGASSITSSWGLSVNSSSFNYSSDVYANTLSAASGYVISNASGVFARAGLYSNTLNIGTYFSVNSITASVNNNLTVTGSVNVVSLQATSNIMVGTAVLLSPLTISVGQTSLNSSSLLIGNSGSTTQIPLIYLANSSGTTNVTSTYISTSWGLVSNSSGLYQNSATIGQITANNSGLYATSLFSNAISANASTVGQVTSNSSGLYTNSIFANQSTVGIVTSNTTGLYTNVISANASSVGQVTSNSSGLYTNTLSANASTVGLVTSNTTGLYTNVISANASTIGQVTSNSTGLYTNTFSANASTVGLVTSNTTGLYANILNANASTIGNMVTNSSGMFVTSLVANSGIQVGNSTVNVTINSTSVLVGNSTVNAFVNSSSIYLGNSSVLLFTANSSGLYTNNQISTSGSFYVGGNLTTTGTTVGTGNYIPSTNSYSLGNTSSRWTLYAMNVYSVSDCTLSANAYIGSSLVVGNSTINAVCNGSSLVYGNSTVNAIINTTAIVFVAAGGNTTLNTSSYTGTANNALYVGGLIAANVVSNAQLQSNLGNYATLSGFNSNVAAYLPAYAGVVNASSVTIGTSASMNATIHYVGNSTVNAVINSTSLTFNNTSVINSTSYPGTANNALYIGGLIAANVVSNAQLSANLSGYLPINASSFAGTANNSLYIGGLIAVNVVSNAQLSGNLGNYQTSAGFTANVAAYLPNYTGVLNCSSISAGNATANIVANSTALYLANSMSSIIITVPTSAQVTNNQYQLNANGSWALDSTLRGTYSSTGLSVQTMDSYAMATYKGAEYIVSAIDNSANNRYFTEFLTTHDTVSSYITEWGMITTNSAVGAFSSSSNASHVLVQFTPTTSSNISLTFTRTIV